MSKACQITGKRAMVGNNVSHSNHKTKRVFNVNLFEKKFYWPEQDCWIRLKVSADGLRLINKIGLNEALKRAAEFIGSNSKESIWQLKKQRGIAYK